MSSQMSQYLQGLQVHINPRSLKTQPGENSPSSPGMMGSPGALSPLSMGPSSPQGMPIPRRAMNEPQHWILNPGGLITSSTFSQGSWNGMTLVDPGEAMDMNMGGSEFDHMTIEGELSKLSMPVDDDDFFKMERNDLLLGPTLAELNAPDADTLLDGLNFDDLYWPADALPPVEATPSPQTPAGGNALDPEDLVPFQVHPSSSFPQAGFHFHRLQNLTGMSVPASSGTILEQTLMQPIVITSDINLNHAPALPQTTTGLLPTSSSNSGGLRELLLRRELQNSLESPDPSPLGQSLPRSSMMASSPGSSSPRLSTSAPTRQGNSDWESWQQRREAVWARRDPRPHLLSTGSLAEAGSASSLVSADVLSPGREFSLSMDEGFDSDDVSDHDSSDEEYDGSDAESNTGSASGTRRERFFWQYNVQAKGPKGQRLVLTPTQEDPHVLQRPTDPVFSPLCHIQGIKHSGKARKGDGNDLTPNPRKLFAIGKELDRLNKTIADMTPVADVPTAVKSRSRKEKNKLASRACRLKKKAQHEANKLKLFGLEQEHKRLMSSIEQARQAVFSKMDGVDPTELQSKIDRISRTGATGHKIGGHTTEFVNRVLDKVKAGVPDGGISDL